MRNHWSCRTNFLRLGVEMVYTPERTKSVRWSLGKSKIVNKIANGTHICLHLHSRPRSAVEYEKNSPLRYLTPFFHITNGSLVRFKRPIKWRSAFSWWFKNKTKSVSISTVIVIVIDLQTYIFFNTTWIICLPARASERARELVLIR